MRLKARQRREISIIDQFRDRDGLAENSGINDSGN